MRRIFIGALAALLVVCTFSSVSFADSSDWTPDGMWNYVLEGEGKYNGYAATLKETGTIYMKTSRDGATESLVGYTPEYSGTLSIPDMNYTYGYSGNNFEYFADNMYTPGETVSYSYTTAIDGTPVQFNISGMQTAENTMLGVATLYIPSTGETNYLSFMATREADSSSGSSYTGSDSGSTTTGSGGGGGGCNAGFGALALFLAAPLLYFRNKV